MSAPLSRVFAAHLLHFQGQRQVQRELDGIELESTPERIASAADGRRPPPPAPYHGLFSRKGITAGEHALPAELTTQPVSSERARGPH